METKYEFRDMRGSLKSLVGQTLTRDGLRDAYRYMREDAYNLERNELEKVLDGFVETLEGLGILRQVKGGAN